MASSILDLPFELRMMVYHYILLCGGFRMLVGLLLSCREIFDEVNRETKRLMEPILKDIETQWNNRLDFPLRIHVPTSIIELSHTIIHLPDGLVYAAHLDKDSFRPYAQVIERVTLLGHLRCGFPPPVRNGLAGVFPRSIYTIEGLNKGEVEKIIFPDVPTHLTGFLLALENIQDRARAGRSHWCMTISTDQQMACYRVHFSTI